MNAKQLGVLLVTAVIIGLAWQVSTRKAPQTEVSRTLLLPDLLEQVNSATRVTLKSRTHETTLTRADDGWHVENKDAFPAVSANVKRTLLQLAALRKIEAKTDSPDRYGKLGLKDLTAEDAAGTLVEVNGATAPLVALIVGHERDAAAGDQRYVRNSAEAQSWLVEGALEVPSDPVHWLDPAIIDIDTARVREVRITTPDGAPPIVITKAERNDNFYALQNVPAGREAKSKAIVSSIAAILLDLRLNDVASKARIADQAAVRHVDVETFDGLVVQLDDYALDDKIVTRVQIAFDPSRVVAQEKPAATPPEEPAATTAADATATTPAETPAEEAARIAAQTGDWVYTLPGYKRRMIERTLDGLLKEPETETDAKP